MVSRAVLGNLADFPLDGRKIDTVPVEWYELEKKLMHKVTAAGEEMGIRLGEDSHHALRQGDVLFEDEQKIVAVDIPLCPLTVIEVHSMEEMGRVCFELGNRHLTLQIEAHKVKTPYDEPTFAYLEKLGFAPRQEMGRFESFTECKGHGHSH